MILERTKEIPREQSEISPLLDLTARIDGVERADKLGSGLK